MLNVSNEKQPSINLPNITPNNNLQPNQYFRSKSRLSPKFSQKFSSHNKSFDKFVKAKENNQIRVVEMVEMMQNKMFKKIQDREERYAQVLEGISEKILQLKRRANYIKVDNGYTTEEYLRYKKILDNRRRKRRLDCLTLLNTLGHSYIHNDYQREFHYHNYPQIRQRHYNGNIYPLIQQLINQY